LGGSEMGWGVLMIRRAALVVALLAQGACPAPASPGKEGVARGRIDSPNAGAALSVQARSVLSARKRRFGALSLLAAFELTSSHRDFGGLSGLSLSRDKRSLLFVSDKGNWFRADLERNGRGELAGLRHWRGGPLHGVYGGALAGHLIAKRGRAWDAEAVSIGEEGTYVSFENAHRLLRFDRLSGKPVEIPLPKAVYQAPRNQGMEAMTLLADGRLLLISEGHFDSRGRHRCWIQQKKFGPFVERALPMSDAYLPTGLAPLPKGGALLLERMFLPNPFGKPIGPHARLSYLSAATLGAKATGELVPRELGRLTDGLLDNFEGLAVERRGRDYLLYLVSDDNFRSSQKTLLFQLKWSPEAR
jgi:hypothetical protein